MDIEFVVFNALIAMEPGQSVRVSDLAKKDPAKFIEIVKLCIDAGAEVQFTNDYSTVKRMDFNRLNESIIDYGKQYREEIASKKI